MVILRLQERTGCKFVNNSLQESQIFFDVKSSILRIVQGANVSIRS